MASILTPSTNLRPPKCAWLTFSLINNYCGHLLHNHVCLICHEADVSVWFCSVWNDRKCYYGNLKCSLICQSLWIKASAKWIDVNVTLSCLVCDAQFFLFNHLQNWQVYDAWSSFNRMTNLRFKALLFSHSRQASVSSSGMFWSGGRLFLSDCLLLPNHSPNPSLHCVFVYVCACVCVTG